jgi:adenylosuccinate lyase
VSAHLADSVLYGHLWSTPEMHALLDDDARVGAWLDILAALAEAQAEVGLVPEEAAKAIRAHADVRLLDLEEVGAQTRATGHSTLGLIRCLVNVLPEPAREWVYYGATVQDVSDTWTALLMRDVADIVERDLARVEAAATALAVQHRDTVTTGRTHGQPGLPITFGFKTAVWVSEIRRHRDRLAEGRARWEVVQLGGALGTMEFWGEKALPLLDAFARRVGLGEPDIPWLTARDRVAEFLGQLAMVTATLAKVGQEIYELQRPEIGEAREGAVAGQVGSITMPHKRNPELSEHLGTLARLVRADASVAVEGMVHEHERDGRAWKAEWVVLPEACLLTGAALTFACRLLEELEVDAERMSANVAAQGGYLMSEPVMRALADRIGKHAAHEVVYEAAMAGQQRGEDLRTALLADPRVTAHLAPADITALLDPAASLGSAPAFVDRVVSGAMRGAPGQTLADRTREALDSLARVPLVAAPTPLQPAPRLSAAIGAEVWFKRDDLTGLGLGGNKVRALEYLLGDAVARGCDCLVTGAGAQSNWAMLAALAAQRCGLEPYLAFYGSPAPSAGNLLLDELIGAEIHYTGELDRASVDDAIEKLAADLSASGRRPCLLPRGGATARGAVGYVRSSLELHEQLGAAELGLAQLWLATGSCGTQAGLVAGAGLLRGAYDVIGVAVSRPEQESATRVRSLAEGALDLLGHGTDAADLADVTIRGGYLGPGYGLPSAEGHAAAALVARTEGVFLDPVFGAKAMAALIDSARAGSLVGPVVFLVTGGAPTLFAHKGTM